MFVKVFKFHKRACKNAIISRDLQLANLNVALLIWMLPGSARLQLARWFVPCYRHREGRPVHAFSVHAHASDPACTADTARLPGQRGAMKRSRSAVTRAAKPASGSEPELGIPDSQEFMCCQNRKRLRSG